MQNNIPALLGDIALKCVHNKINFNLDFKKVVDELELPCSGFFDEKSIVVATDKKNKIDWIGTLIHESCHLDQFLEKSKAWVEDDVGLIVVENWIHGKIKDKSKAFKSFVSVINMELDCEKRSVKKFEKYKIKFNKKQYIKQANAYLYSYVYAFKNKKWYPTPYEKKTIVNKMPSEFLKPLEYYTTYLKVENYFK